MIGDSDGKRSHFRHLLMPRVGRSVKWDVVAAVVSLASVMTACSPSPGTPLELSASATGIVGGETVKGGDPIGRSTVGLLLMKGNRLLGTCSGTLVFQNVVLTAAHCLDGEVERVRIVFSLNFSNLGPTVVREMVAKEIHPEWGLNLPTGNGDLALIKFSGTTPMGYGIARVLPSEKSIDFGTSVWIAGYGVTDPRSMKGTGILRRAKVVILSSISETEVAVSGQSASTCYGDSGGPSYVEIDGLFYFWGVTSATTSDLCNDMAVFTDARAQGRWVASAARKLLGLK